MDEPQREGVVRRDFLKTSALAAVAGGLVLGDWTGNGRAEAAGALKKRLLGATRFNVTELSLGCMNFTGPEHERLLEQAIEGGINLIHVSPGYQNGKSMQVVGNVLKRRDGYYRKKVFLALKTSPGDVARCLPILGTDWIDILIPNLHPKELTNAQQQAAFASLKKKGVIRATGFATHDGMAEAINAAAKAGGWDVVLVAYNKRRPGDLDGAIHAAHQNAGMGFLVMKSGQGVQAGDKAEFAAQVYSLLQNRNLTSITAGMRTADELHGNLTTYKKGTFGPTAQPVAATGVCSMCAHCSTNCPRGIAVSEYLRAWNYRERGDHQLAAELIAAIPQRRSLAMCNHCGVCNGSCSRQIDVPARMLEAVQG